MTFEERFWAKVDVRGDDECWPWLGATNGGGNGVIKCFGSKVTSQRAVLGIVGRTIHPGSQVRHTCGNKSCCNPSHLEAPTLEERFWAKVEKQAGDGCWLWTANINQNGYGLFYGTKMCSAHRLAYELVVGPVPEGLQLDHLCRTKHCVRPDHLEPVTAKVNTRRYAATITECPHGHPYTPENTYRDYRGSRICRTCLRPRWRKQYHEKKRRAG